MFSRKKLEQAGSKRSRLLKAITPTLQKRNSDSGLRTHETKFAPPITLSSQSSDCLPMPTDVVELDRPTSSEAVITAETVSISKSCGLATDMPIVEITNSTEMEIFAGLPPLPTDDPFGDRKRTISRYKIAAEKLQASLNSSQAHWKSFKIPEKNIPDKDPISQLREEINKTLTGRKEEKKSWIEKVFSAISPFAKNFLTIAKEGQAVYLLIIRARLILLATRS
jgi:hypothetical protein